MKIHIVKDTLLLVVGAVGAFISAAFGGWDAALTTLIIFMVIDYITGIIVAAVFHKSEKTPDGTLESRVGWKGLCRKGVSLLVVLIACRLDLLMGTSFIRDTVVIGFVANETLSLTHQPHKKHGQTFLSVFHTRSQNRTDACDFRDRRPTVRPYGTDGRIAQRQRRNRTGYVLSCPVFRSDGR